MRGKLRVVGFVLAFALTAQAARAADYPARNLEIICPFGAGGAFDLVVRHFARKLESLVQRPVIVVNKVGAAGHLGTLALMNAKTDGHTLGILSTGPLLGNPFLFKDANYDPLSVLMPVTILAEVGFVLVVRPDLPVKNVDELTRFLKEKGTKATYGTQSLSSTVNAELYKVASGIQATPVAYKAMTEVVTAVALGELDFAFADASLALTQAKAGKLRALAISTGSRSVAAPDLPTMIESGFPGHIYSGVYGVYVPNGTPVDIVQKLESLFNRIVVDDETRSFLNNNTTDPISGSREVLLKRMRSDLDHVKAVSKSANIVPQ